MTDTAESAEPIRLGRDFLQDPHAVYQRLGDAPVHRVITSTGLAAWLVTGYPEARAALADARLSKDGELARTMFRRHQVNTDTNPAMYNSDLSAHMLNMDPPDHTRLRGLVNRAFTGRTIAALRPRIQRITDDLLDGMAGPNTAGPDTTVDLISAFAFPLPITVITEMLGVPGADRDAFREWTGVLLSPVGVNRTEVAEQVADYLHRLVAEKRESPGDDLLTELVHASADGDRMSVPELISMAFLLMVAGHETTVNLIGNGVLDLLGHPDQLAALRADRDLLPNAVEELLRHDGPLNTATLRFTTAPVDVAGTTIPAGEIVIVALAGPNRDARRYPDPDRLDITRDAGGHIAFGHGIHFCVGAPLARMEGQIAIGSLLDRFDIELAVPAESLTWRVSTIIHGLETMPVRLTPRG